MGIDLCEMAWKNEECSRTLFMAHSSIPSSSNPTHPPKSSIKPVFSLMRLLGIHLELSEELVYPYAAIEGLLWEYRDEDQHQLFQLVLLLTLSSVIQTIQRS